ncbi:MAG: SGNH/GDSL hydrolase family protein [Opitutaceae bacterium]
MHGKFPSRSLHHNRPGRLLACSVAGLLPLLACGAPAAHWVGSWTTPQQIPEPRNALAPAQLRNATLRQIVHLSIGGDVLRVRLSNAFGYRPFTVAAAHIALAKSPAHAAIEPGSDRALLFAGSPTVTIPGGASYLSDPISFDVAPGANLAVSLYIKEPPRPQTGHPGSRATSYIVPGDRVSADDLPQAATVEHWYALAEVDVEAPRNAASVVCFGDSITDGHASTVNGNNRWSDDLARRLNAGLPGREIGVLNAGIGGNRLLNYGLGPDGLARFGRDVLGPQGVRYLIILEGINDIGTFDPNGVKSPAAHHELEHELIATLEQMIERSHAHGIRVYGGTITPFVGSGYYHPHAISEADREAVNAWIRKPGNFDAVIDFDKAVRDPADPHRILPAYDSGDHLHPSPRGYQVMADAIPLKLFRR